MGLGKELMQQAIGNVKRTQDLLGKLDSVRSKQADTKISFEKKKAEFIRYGAVRQWQLSLEDRFKNLVDPRTGKTNVDFTKMAIEAAMAEDPEYVRKEAEFADARDALYLAEVGVLNLAEELGVAKSNARLLAAMIAFASEDDDGPQLIEA